MEALNVAALSMQDDLVRLSVISQNLANVTTTGYKRAVPFSQHIENAASQSAAVPAHTSVPLVQTVIDPGAGALRYTGNPLDVAIEGDAYFELLTESGTAYSRHGTLRIDSRGRLVNANGHPLAGLGGELFVAGSSASIERNGEVRQGERIVGQLKLVRFDNPERMTALGDGMFAQGGARIADPGSDSAVRAGYLESSNVNSPHEMIRLTETVRHFESMQKIFQGCDEMMDNAIRKLGDF